MKRFLYGICAFFVLLTAFCPAVRVVAEPEQNQEQETQGQEGQSGSLALSSPSALLMEASTGQVIYEQNADEQRSPASITKIMTLLLIFEELEKGNLTMDEEVTTSAYAKSMGGSQVFLEEGEKQTVETMIKCIVVASGNDAAVAMAEHIAGTESEFVARMNARAASIVRTIWCRATGTPAAR